MPEAAEAADAARPPLPLEGIVPIGPSYLVDSAEYSECKPISSRQDRRPVDASVSVDVMMRVGVWERNDDGGLGGGGFRCREVC